MSWASPHPTSGGPQPAIPPPAVPPAYAVPPVYAPMPTPPPRKRRTGLVVLLVTLPLVLLVGLGVAVAALLGGTKQLSDVEGRVSIMVPSIWLDETSDDAGKHVDDGQGGYEVPDLEISDFSGDLWVSVVVSPRDGLGLEEAHAADIDSLCEEVGCLSRGKPTAVTVNGRPGFEQTVTHPDSEMTILLTLASETLIVSVGAETYSYLPAGKIERLRAIMRTTSITG